ncbi:MAG TPA: nitronate monooxygenase [Candidatus Acidoferrum sp.]|nr:nitronate monooxygenase [Candidatus Acidoferrum sp.]
MKTRFTEAFGIRHPILCAPMALIAGGRLTAAVSDAGGLGILGAGYAGALGGEPDLEKELALAKGRKFGVGFISWALDRAPQALDQTLTHSPFCVFLSFGEPKPHAKKIHAAKARLICQAQTLRHVEQALDAGADTIVAQGTEAGGHGASRSTLPLVPEVADHLAKRSPKTLLLAAGGIADGRGLAAALMLGADGALVGTRFWAAAEALTPEAMIERAVRASGDDTVRTKAIDALRGVPWPQEFSFRVLKNKFTDEWAHRETEAAAAGGSLAEAYAKARKQQDLEMYLTVVGEAAGLLHDRPSAASIIESMVTQAESLLKSGASLDFRTAS